MPFSVDQATKFRFMNKVDTASDETFMEYASALFSGTKGLRSPRVVFLPQIRDLKHGIAQSYSKPRSLDEAYHHFGDLLSEWTTSVSDYHLAQLRSFVKNPQDRDLLRDTLDIQRLIIRIGYSLEQLAVHSPANTYINVESMLTEISMIRIYPFFKELKNIDFRAVLSGIDTEVGSGYVDACVLPATLVPLFGLLARHVCADKAFQNISGGGNNRQFFVFEHHAITQKGESRRNQYIINDLERSLNLILLISDFHFWKLYRFTADQIGIAILRGGFANLEPADTQVAHLDINMGFSDFYSKKCAKREFALACILSLHGNTHLFIEPHSWGCHQRTNPVDYDLKPGHLLVFRGNLMHGGRSHVGLSVRAHWYRPLKTQILPNDKPIFFCK